MINSNYSSRQSRRESYGICLSEFAGKQGFDICMVLRIAGAMTSAEITEVTGFARSSVCGRLSTLRKAGIVREVGRAKDPVSNISVTRYDINSNLFNTSTIDSLKEKIDSCVTETKENYNLNGDYRE